VISCPPTADEDGNLSVIEEEAMLAEILPMAQAAKTAVVFVIASSKYIGPSVILFIRKEVKKVPGVLRWTLHHGGHQRRSQTNHWYCL